MTESASPEIKVPIMLFTIGFTGKSAEQFFTALQNAGVKRLIDIRLNNVSQLAGFAKRDDLEYFLKEIGGIEYVHEPMLAPTQEILDAYKKRKGSWSDFTDGYLALIRERKVEAVLSPESFRKKTVLLCSEATAEHCHRRLALEYLQQHWEGVIIRHL